MSDKKLTLLDSLTEEQKLELLKELNQQLGIKQLNNPTTTKRKQTRRRKKTVDNQSEEPTLPKQRRQRRKQGVLPETKEKSRRVGGRKGSPGYIESVDTSGKLRRNKFMDFVDESTHAEDIAIDRTLNPNRSISPRRGKFKYVEIECSGCHKIYDVHPNLIYVEDGEYIFYCNRCGGRR